MSNWQPIETAPKDGWMLLAASDGAVHCGCMESGRPMVIVFDSEAFEVAAIEPSEAGWVMTHWMPLPSAPPTDDDDPERYRIQEARERDDDDGRTYADPRDERDERARR